MSNNPPYPYRDQGPPQGHPRDQGPPQGYQPTQGWGDQRGPPRPEQGQRYPQQGQGQYGPPRDGGDFSSPLRDPYGPRGDGGGFRQPYRGAPPPPSSYGQQRELTRWSEAPAQGEPLEPHRAFPRPAERQNQPYNPNPHSRFTSPPQLPQSQPSHPPSHHTGLSSPPNLMEFSSPSTAAGKTQPPPPPTVTSQATGASQPSLPASIPSMSDLHLALPVTESMPGPGPGPRTRVTYQQAYGSHPSPIPDSRLLSVPRESHTPSHPSSSGHSPSSPSSPSIHSRPTDASTHITGKTSTDASSNPANVAQEGMEPLKLTSFYVRPGFGTAGKKIQVHANYYQVRTVDKRGRVIHHYDVEINPVVRDTNQKRPRSMLRAVWEQLILEQTSQEWKKAFDVCAFDGRKNCFTPILFPIEEGQSHTLITTLASDRTIQRPDNRDASSDGEERRFKVTLKRVAKIDLEAVMEFCRPHEGAPQSEEACITAVMATNVLLRDVPSKRYTQVGATGNKFYTMMGSAPLPNGAMVCKGFMQSFRYSSSGLPLLNIDLGCSAFLKPGPALNVVRDILGPGGRGRTGDILDSHLDERAVALLKRKLRGARFTVTHRQSSRLHTVLTVTLKSAEEIFFAIEGKDGQQAQKMSVANYYREHYAPLQRPYLPCVQYSKRACIPLEFVNLAEFNSLPPMNLTAEQTAAMIKFSAVSPDVYANTVNQWRKELAYETQSKIAAWGLQVNTKLIEMEGRLLQPPPVAYRTRNAFPQGGTWNMKGNQFYRDGNRPLVNWSIISFDKWFDRDDMERYVEFLCRFLRNLGVTVENQRPPIIPPVDPRMPENIVNGLKEAARAAYMVNKQTPQLILCVLPGRDAWLYENIKKASFTDLKFPVPTQCMQSAKIRKSQGLAAYTDNLAMKVVSKLGGLSHQVPPKDLPGVVRGKTMLLGADLGHPPMRFNSESPTVACSVATFNADCSAYSCQIRLQKGRVEVIQDLSSMVEEHLKVFAKNNDNEYPERILMFRDGISEGQYAAALQYEHDAIVKACARIQPDYRPRIMVCVCARRHTTRFFGHRPNTERNGNLPAGLCIDRSVTHPYAFDFYLQAHAGRIGTARPTHYICLLDELALTPDDLQQLVYGLCHTFARCTVSVSLVPVCYMADLVCQKARMIAAKQTSSVAASVTSGGRSFNRGAPGPPPPSVAPSEPKSVLFTSDVYEIQNLIKKNPELSEVSWWM